MNAKTLLGQKPYPATVYSMTAQQKKQVGDLKALLEKMPKEGSFDPALEFKLELLQLLLPFCLNNRKFSAFLTELRDVLLARE